MEQDPLQRTSPANVWPMIIGIVLVTVAVYWNSFAGQFLFDDPGSIDENDTIHVLWPLSVPLTPPRGQGITVEGRPIINLSLAVNYAINDKLGINQEGPTLTGDLPLVADDTSKISPEWSYHLVNLLIHIATALTLFGLVRRTLMLPKLADHFARSAPMLALAIAGIWAVHPLLTESVTYIIQRAESLMGLFYLLTLYCAVRSATGPQGRWWLAGAVAACGLGMGSKEVMVSAPIAVMLYDRIFIFDDLRQMFKRRWATYGLLASTWGILCYELTQSGNRAGTAGFGKVTAWDYAQTQTVVICRYIKLCFWPRPLVLDYGTRLFTGWSTIWPFALVIGVMLLVSVLLVIFRPKLGYLAMFFWMTLAPASSFVPVVTQTAAEHRMYLPLMAVVAFVVMGLAIGYGKIAERLKLSEDARWMTERVGPSVLLLGVIAALGWGTYTRNQDYSSRAKMWIQAKDNYPQNARAWQNIACMFSLIHEYDKALEVFTEAIKHDPLYAPAWVDRAGCHVQMGNKDLAIRDYTQAIQIDPTCSPAFSCRGAMLFEQGKSLQALDDLNHAVSLRPNYAIARFNRGCILMDLKRVDDALIDFNEAIRLRPKMAGAYTYRADILRFKGNLVQAMADANKAIELEPRKGSAYLTRAGLYVEMKQIGKARADIETARGLGRQPNAELTRRFQEATSRPTSMPAS